MSSKEIAVLAGGCFRGMQGLVRKLPGLAAHASATAVTFPMPPTVVAARSPRHSKQSSLRSMPVFARCWNSSFRSTIPTGLPST